MSEDYKPIKVKSTLLDYVEYVNLETLPSEQYEGFRLYLDTNKLVKPIIPNERDCAYYKDYFDWYEGVYGGKT